MTDQIVEPTELEALKQRADQMGLAYHPSIGVDALRDKVKAHLTGQNAPQVNVTVQTEFKPTAEALQFSVDQNNNYIRRQALRLVRVQLVCMNPNKKEWEGEMFMVQNDILTAKRYVPFNVPWHVEQCLLDMIQDRQCQIFRNHKQENGVKTQKPVYISEFSVSILPPLTEQEIEDLRKAQALRGE
jgi:hypothetical protein